MTYKEFARVIGLCNDEFTQEDNEKLSLVMQTLYVMEYHCGVYERASYDRITWEPRNSPWNWGGRDWDWAKRHPPGH